MLKLGPKLLFNILGTTWDEYGNSNVVQILISHQPNTIKSIQFVYADNGCLRHSQTYGELAALNFNIVTFKHPSEYLTSVSGAYTFQQTTDNNNSIIIAAGGLTSLTFGTNKAKYEPFGGSGGGTIDPKSITYPFDYDFGQRSCFLGFHGTVNKLSQVSAIGVYVKPTGSLDELLEDDEEAVRLLRRSTKKVVPSYYI